MSNPKFDEIIDRVLAAEKGYVNNPADRGGPTNYGITVAVARANGYQGEMRDLPIGLARAIYERRYIVEPRFDKVAELSEQIGMEVVDTGVNMGPARAAEFLQRWLNGFNHSGSFYADVFVDGRIGPMSLKALAGFLKWRGAEGVQVMLRGLNSVQGARYLDLAERDRSQRQFLYGWVGQRVAI